MQQRLPLLATICIAFLGVNCSPTSEEPQSTTGIPDSNSSGTSSCALPPGFEPEVAPPCKLIERDFVVWTTLEKIEWTYEPAMIEGIDDPTFTTRDSCEGSGGTVTPALKFTFRPNRVFRGAAFLDEVGLHLGAPIEVVVGVAYSMWQPRPSFDETNDLIVTWDDPSDPKAFTPGEELGLGAYFSQEFGKTYWPWFFLFDEDGGLRWPETTGCTTTLPGEVDGATPDELEALLSQCAAPEVRPEEPGYEWEGYFNLAEHRRSSVPLCSNAAVDELVLIQD